MMLKTIIEDEDERENSPQYLIGRYNNQGSPRIIISGYQPSSPQEQVDDMPGTPPSGLHRNHLNRSYALSEHLFDYSNPWKAAGIVIGVESPPSEPLEKSWMLRDLDPDPNPIEKLVPKTQEHSSDSAVLEVLNGSETFFARSSSRLSSAPGRIPVLSPLPTSSAGSYTESSPSLHLSLEENHSQQSYTETSFPVTASPPVEKAAATQNPFFSRTGVFQTIDTPAEAAQPNIRPPVNPAFARESSTLAFARDSDAQSFQNSSPIHSTISTPYVHGSSAVSGIGIVTSMLSEHVGRPVKRPLVIPHQRRPTSRSSFLTSSSSDKLTSFSKLSSPPPKNLSRSNELLEKSPRQPLQAMPSVTKTVRFAQDIGNLDRQYDAKHPNNTATLLVPAPSLFVDEPIQESSEDSD